MSRIADFLTRRAGWVLLATLALSALPFAALVDPGSGALRIWIDPSINRLVPADDDERLFYEHVRKVFGTDESVIVAVASADVFSLDTLAAVARLSEALEALPGVQEVLSLATVPNLRLEDEALAADTVTAAALADPAAIEDLRGDVRANPLYAGVLVSPDERVTALVVRFERLSDREFIERGMSARVEAVAATERGRAGVDAVWVTGSPILKAATSEALLRELTVALPAIAVVGAAVLFLAFGSGVGVLLPLATILLALLWTLGTLAWLGRPMNLVTVLVPPLIITLGLAYTMHVVAEYYRSPADATSGDRGARRERVRDAVAEVALPVAITGITTIAGLLALVLSPLAAIREFGQISVLGTLYTVVLALLFLPAALACLAPRPSRRALPFAGVFHRAAAALGAFDIRRRRALLAGGVLLFAAAAAGMTQIEVGTRYIANFAPDAPVRAEYEAVNAAFGGSNPFTVVLEANLRDAFVDPELLREVEKLQEWLEQQPEIGTTTSVVDHLKLLNRSIQGGEQHFALPERQELAKQLLVFGGGQAVGRTVDPLYHTAAIEVRANVDDSVAVAELIERIEARLARLPLPLQGRVTGSSVLLNATVENIARGQLTSIFAALLVIYGILSLLFSSWRVGGIALLPNALPIVIYFGALGWLSIWLGPSTSLIACIALGIAVDDTIHYMVRFRSEARRSASETRATVAALDGVFRPITFTSLALCLGFLVLTTSELRNQVEFGGLCALTLAAAWLIDVTLTPALCAGVNIVTLWDVLLIDLGVNPHLSIPLFRGLSRRQTRIFALTADIQSFGAGELVRRQDDPADDMFVVIEGSLAVWYDRNGARVDLHQVGRGDLVGHVGFFLQRHATNVEALTDVRLLRFEDVDLELMLRRYPRIAAQLLWNLNHSQASILTGAMRGDGAA